MYGNKSLDDVDFMFTQLPRFSLPVWHHRSVVGKPVIYISGAISEPAVHPVAFENRAPALAERLAKYVRPT